MSSLEFPFPDLPEDGGRDRRAVHLSNGGSRFCQRDSKTFSEIFLVFSGTGLAGLDRREQREPKLWQLQHPERGRHGRLVSAGRPRSTAGTGGSFLVALAVSAVVCSFPELLQLHHATVHGAVAVENKAKEVKYYLRQKQENGGLFSLTLVFLLFRFWLIGSHRHFFLSSAAPTRVFIHPSSVHFSANSFVSPWLVYLDLVSSTHCVHPFRVKKTL